MMAHNLSAHALSSALNHRSSPYLSQEHMMIPNRHIPVLSVPEILGAFQQSHPSNTTNLCNNSLIRSVGMHNDLWELPELKWLDPADNHLVASSDHPTDQADKLYADQSLPNLVPEKFSLDGGDRWPFSALYNGDHVAKHCASAVDDSLTQFTLQSMVTTSPASSGSSVLIESNRGVSSANTVSSFASRDFPTSAGSRVPDWCSKTTPTTAACSSASQKRSTLCERPESDLSKEKSISGRSRFKAGADNCLPERLVSNREVPMLTTTPYPPEKRRKLQGGAAAAARGSSSTGPAQKTSTENLKASVSTDAAINDQRPVSPSRETSKKSAAAVATAATIVSDHEIHIWTERERRKKMNGMFTTLHSLLPHLTSKADKSKIVDEAINYIQSLEVTMKGMLKRKFETGGGSSSPMLMPSSLAHLQAAQHACPSMAAAAAAETGKPIPATTGNGRVEVKPSATGSSGGSAATSPGESQQFQTLCTPNIVLNVCGTDAFITICSPRGIPGLLCRVLFVMDAHRLHVLNAQITTTDDTLLFMLHAQSIDKTQLTNSAMLNVALEDLTNCLTSIPQ